MNRATACPGRIRWSSALVLLLALLPAGCRADRGAGRRPFGTGPQALNSTLGHDLRNLPRGRMIAPPAPGVDLARTRAHSRRPLAAKVDAATSTAALTPRSIARKSGGRTTRR